jgi:hypothetical protein
VKEFKYTGRYIYRERDRVRKSNIHTHTSLTSLEVHDAAKASTACTAMYKPGTLKVSNMISAVYSRFSGVFNGGSVNVT